MKHSRIIKIPVTTLKQNCRIIVDTATNAGAIVDPGGDVKLIIKTIKKEAVDVKYVLLTHAHFDHAGGVGKLISELKALGHNPVFMAHQAEDDMRASVSIQAGMFGAEDEGFQDCPKTDKYLDDGETFTLGDKVNIQALFTPGHSPGHLSFLVSDPEPNCVITGDALFYSSIGRTDLPGSNGKMLITSIKSKLFALPENVRVMPGHGIDSEIGYEKKYNPFLV